MRGSIFFSPYFTEEIKQLVAGLKVVKRMSLSEKLDLCRVLLKIKSLREELQSELTVWMVNDSIVDAFRKQNFNLFT
jgi:hypothetical protein